MDELVAAATQPVMENEESFALIDEWDFSGEESGTLVPAHASQEEDSDHGRDATEEHDGAVGEDAVEHVITAFGEGDAQGKSDQPYFIFADWREVDMEYSRQDTPSTHSVGYTTERSAGLDVDPGITSPSETSRYDTPTADASNAKFSPTAPTFSQQAPAPGDLDLDAGMNTTVNGPPEAIAYSCNPAEVDHQELESHQGEASLEDHAALPAAQSLPEPDMAGTAPQDNQDADFLSKTPAMKPSPAAHEPSSDKRSLYEEMQIEDNARELRSNSSTPEITPPPLFRELASSGRGRSDKARVELTGFEDVPDKLSSINAQGLADATPAAKSETVEEEVSQGDGPETAMPAVKAPSGERHNAKVKRSKTQKLPTREKKPLDGGSQKQSSTMPRPRTRKATQEAMRSQADAGQNTAAPQPQAMVPTKRRGRAPKNLTKEDTTLAAEPAPKKRKTAKDQTVANVTATTADIATSNGEASSATTVGIEDGDVDNGGATSTISPADEPEMQSRFIPRAVKALQGYWNTVAGAAPTTRRRKGGESEESSKPEGMGVKDASTGISSPASNREDAVPLKQASHAPSADGDKNAKSTAASTEEPPPTIDASAPTRKRPATRHPLKKHELSMLGVDSAQDDTTERKTRARTAREAEMGTPGGEAVKARRRGGGKETW